MRKPYEITVKCAKGDVIATTYAESKKEAEQKVRGAMKYTIYRMGGEV